MKRLDEHDGLPAMGSSLRFFALTIHGETWTNAPEWEHTPLGRFSGGELRILIIEKLMLHGPHRSTAVRFLLLSLAEPSADPVKPLRDFPDCMIGFERRIDPASFRILQRFPFPPFCVILLLTLSC